MYRLIIDGFQKEFSTRDDAAKFASKIMGADLYHINVDETKQPKGIRIPTVFVKTQSFDHDSIILASNHLSALSVVFANNAIKPTIKLITINNQQ